MRKFLKGLTVVGVLLLITSMSAITIAQATKVPTKNTQGITKDQIQVTYATKKFTLATGKAKILLKVKIKQELVFQIIDNKGKVVATLPKVVAQAKATATVFWNGRKRIDATSGFNDYVTPGNYTVKISGLKSSIFIKKIKVMASSKQVISKFTTSPTGYVGEKFIKILFSILRKQDVFIKLSNKDGKIVLLKKLRDVKAKVLNSVLISGRANNENKLGLADNTPLPAGEYKITVSSNGMKVEKKIRLLAHFSPLNLFHIKKEGDSFVATWINISGAIGYQVRVKSLQDNKIQTYKVDTTVVDGNIACDISKSLANMSVYSIEVYAFGDLYHPLTKVGTFEYSFFGKLSTPENLMLINDNGVIWASCNPVSNADSYEIKAYFNSKLVNTFKISNNYRQDISKAIREKGFGEYTFSVKALNNINKVFAESDINLSNKLIFEGFRAPTDVKVTVDGNGRHIANWSSVKGVHYYVINVYSKDLVVQTIVSGANYATLTEFVPPKGETYQISVYSLGDDVHPDSLAGQILDFIS